MQTLYEASPTLGNLAAAQGAKAKLARDQAAMRALIADANSRSRMGKPVLHRDPEREWAGDMPGTALPRRSGRSADELLSLPSVERRLERAGVSKAAAKRAMAGELAARGGAVRDFGALTPSEQQVVLGAALARRKPTASEARHAGVKPVNEQTYSALANAARRRGDHADAPPERCRLLIEIDAQNYLLFMTERYNIPDEEVAHTRANLEDYEEQLRRLDEVGP